MIEAFFIALESFSLFLVFAFIFTILLGYLFCGKEAKEYSPESYGRITKNGNPLCNSVVILKIYSFNYFYKESCTTNTNGEFRFNSVLKKRRKVFRTFDGLFQTVMKIEIITEVDDREVKIWDGSFRQYKVGKVERVNMSNLQCEITDPLKRYELYSYGHYVLTQCKLTKFNNYVVEK